MAAFKVVIIEVTKEWGSEVTETKTFTNQKAAAKFVKSFNTKHGIDDLPSKPDWYMFAKPL